MFESGLQLFDFGADGAARSAAASGIFFTKGASHQPDGRNGDREERE